MFNSDWAAAEAGKSKRSDGLPAPLGPETESALASIAALEDNDGTVIGSVRHSSQFNLPQVPETRFRADCCAMGFGIIIDRIIIPRATRR